MNSTWYTLDDGIKIPFSELMGTINETEWDKKGDGLISIKFYANDTLGQEDYAEVIISKDTTAPTSTISFR